MTFEEWFLQQQKESGFPDPWQDSYAAAKDAWDAAILYSTEINYGKGKDSPSIPRTSAEG